MGILHLSADVNIESPPPMHPCKRICDITGFEVLIPLNLLTCFLFDSFVKGTFLITMKRC